MAGIFERMAMIARSNVNELLDRFEDPQKMVDQAIIDAKTEYAKVKKEALSVLANESAAGKELESLRQEADKWHQIAARALQAGNEEDARTALEKEGSLRERAQAQEKTFAAAKAAADKLRDRLGEMEREITAMEDRAAQIKAMAVTARATKAASRVTEQAGGRGALDAFSRMEEKAARELAEAEALEELNRPSGRSETEALEKKYGASGSGSVDEALEALRREIGEG